MPVSQFRTYPNIQTQNTYKSNKITSMVERGKPRDRTFSASLTRHTAKTSDMRVEFIRPTTENKIKKWKYRVKENGTKQIIVRVYFQQSPDIYYIICIANRSCERERERKRGDSGVRGRMRTAVYIISNGNNKCDTMPFVVLFRWFFRCVFVSVVLGFICECVREREKENVCSATRTLIVASNFLLSLLSTDLCLWDRDNRIIHGSTYGISLCILSHISRTMASTK